MATRQVVEVGEPTGELRELATFGAEVDLTCAEHVIECARAIVGDRHDGRTARPATWAASRSSRCC
jgi:hypothetical protein